jgi:hypothetical protein
VKTREEIITAMCYTMRHDYGLVKDPLDLVDLPNQHQRTFDYFAAGMYQEERAALWNQMAQLFDNNILPFMEFKQ